MSFGIFIITIKLVIETTYFNVLNHIAIWGSLVFYVLVVFLESQFLELVPTMYKEFDILNIIRYPLTIKFLNPFS